MDVRRYGKHDANSVCICPEGYTGDYCQYRQKQTQIVISFHHIVNVPSLLRIHFVGVSGTAIHNTTTIMKKIKFDQYSSIIYTIIRFNIAFVQMNTDYYLIILQEKTIVLADISVEITPSLRCLSIKEIFNQTFANQHLLKRIKYYHLPCKQRSELVCFYDDNNFCLCTLDRTANCFEFNHSIPYDCGGMNVCENDGYCFQDDARCPSPPFCACRQCSFGSRCQFSTTGSTLSLDIILGYHIHPSIGINQQPVIVKIAIVFTIVLVFFGFVNIFCSLITFRQKQIRSVGCGLYLFVSTIISLNTLVILILKFFLLLASQIGSINNRRSLYMQCVSMDFSSSMPFKYQRLA